MLPRGKSLVVLLMIGASVLYLTSCSNPADSGNSNDDTGTLGFSYAVDGGEQQNCDVTDGKGDDEAYGWISTMGSGLYVKTVKYNADDNVDYLLMNIESSDLSEGREFTITSTFGGYHPSVRFSLHASAYESGDYQYQLSSGTVKIVVNDEEKNYIAGTFSGEATGQDGTSITVTSGMFGVHLD